MSRAGETPELEHLAPEVRMGLDRLIPNKTSYLHISSNLLTRLLVVLAGYQGYRL